MRRLVRIWVICLAFTVAAGAVLIAFSMTHGGGAVVYKNGEYVLMRGRLIQPIEQRLAVVLRLTSLVFAAVGIAAIVLTAVIRIDSGSINPFVVVPRYDPGNQAVLTMFNVALVAAALAVVTTSGIMIADR